MRCVLIIIELLCFLMILSIAIVDSTCAWEFFDCGIDFFGDCKKKKEDNGKKETRQENIWAEPVTSSDGKTTIYIPPRHVTDFVDNPTKENAMKYLLWNIERIEKIKKAQEVLEEVAKEIPHGH